MRPSLRRPERRRRRSGCLADPRGKENEEAATTLGNWGGGGGERWDNHHRLGGGTVAASATEGVDAWRGHGGARRPGAIAYDPPDTECRARTRLPFATSTKANADRDGTGQAPRVVGRTAPPRTGVAVGTRSSCARARDRAQG